MIGKTSRRDFFSIGIGLLSVPFALQTLDTANVPNEHYFDSKNSKIPNQVNSRLPRWRGFNLLEKFNGSNQPFLEDDFRNISDLGFNFVRLPMDYRTWTVDGNKENFEEKTLEEIDQAVEFGQKYGIHVQLNFHRAPGYTVAFPSEDPLIWNNRNVLDICKLHWQTFARRYQSIPSEQLSFNLFNEPANCSEEEYFNVVRELVDVIHVENSSRLIYCDGIDWGTKPCISFKKIRVSQSTRGYLPMEISHYGAPWINTKDFPEPQWPSTIFNGLLPALTKAEFPDVVRGPLTIKGNFLDNSTLRLRIGRVSYAAEIVVSFDNVPSYRRTFVPSSGKGDWKESFYNPTYHIYQNLYDLDIEVNIPNGTKVISITNIEGDWLTISKLTISSTSTETTALGSDNWKAQELTTLFFEVVDGNSKLLGGELHNRQWLWNKCIAPWQKVEDHNSRIMVGEFGAHNITPSHVVLSWMEDMLINWHVVNWGWALWNFRGTFGVANSCRLDVNYEDWRGLDLDRKMLSLLQRY